MSLPSSHRTGAATSAPPGGAAPAPVTALAPVSGSAPGTFAPVSRPAPGTFAPVRAATPHGQTRPTHSEAWLIPPPVEAYVLHARDAASLASAARRIADLAPALCEAELH